MPMLSDLRTLCWRNGIESDSDPQGAEPRSVVSMRSGVLTRPADRRSGKDRLKRDSKDAPLPLLVVSGDKGFCCQAVNLHACQSYCLSSSKSGVDCISVEQST